MTLKVYGWEGMRAPLSRNQTREIVAARSKAEVARIVGEKYPSNLFNLAETGNEGEIQKAMSEPGTVFWRPLDGERDEWYRSLSGGIATEGGG